MAELTIEQQKTLALAAARKRLIEAGASAVASSHHVQEQPATRDWSANSENVRKSLAPYSVHNQPSLGEVFDAFQMGAHNGLTWGFGDEINAGLQTPFRTAGQAIDGDLIDLGKAYGEGLADTRAYMDERTSKSPGAAFVGELVGGLASGSTLAKLGTTVMKAGVPVLETIVRGLLEGGVYGGISGFGNSRSEDLLGRLGDAGTGALWGAGTGSILSGGGAALTGAGKKVPVRTGEDLNAAALVEYAQAAAAGVKARKPQTATLAATIRDVAESNGLVSSNGRLGTSHIADAIRAFDDAAGRKMSVAQMKALRVRLTDLTKSSDPTEQRIATQMLEEFDRFTGSLDPSLKAGNELFHSASKGDLIEAAIERAGSDANQRSGTAFENALRAEFRTLQHQIRKGELRGLTDAEIDAINKVADGTPIANVLRGVGKLTPEGVIPTVALTVLADQTPLGTQGAAGALALAAAGVGSRIGATTLTKKAAESAASIARNGGVAVPRKQLTAEELALIAELLRGTSLEAGQLPLETPARPALSP